MKPNVAPAGMVRRVASLLLAGALLSSPVHAGDRAQIDYLGYSDDGRYFAFEEFGVQDGSGFPYSNIYVVDLVNDTWVDGTPFRVRLDEEQADVAEARTEAAQQAAATLERYGVLEAVLPLAVNGDGEADADWYALRFGRPGYGLAEAQDVQRLTLTTFPADSPEDCETYLGQRALGFALSLDGNEIYRDAGELPRSRGCATDYRLHAVVAPAGWTFVDGGRVAIISSYPFGFEGPDRRFLAVPLPE